MRKGATPVTFDTSLEAFVRTLAKQIPIPALEAGWVIRDASGHLLFVAGQSIDEGLIEKVAVAVRKALPQYCRETCVIDIDFPGIRRIVASANSLFETITISEKRNEFVDVVVRVVDRRIVGQDWLVPPAPSWQPPSPARVVFASLKGGVGRSTALVVLAAELAQRGRKVLAIDLDLEAPGIGTMLLRDVERPKYGVLDWFVERGVCGDGADMGHILSEMVGISSFGSSKGLIHVIPAVGLFSDLYPGNVLAKIARAYLELPKADGTSLSFLQQTQEMIIQLSSLNSYDVILIDARAGLNESTAAAILGIGADVLLFGIDTPQTFSSYRYLLAHLAKFPRDENDDWLYRLRMVHAKASRDLDAQTAFRDRAYDVFREFLYRDVQLLDEAGNPLMSKSGKPLSSKKEFGLTEPTAPHFAWPILSDTNYAEFDPCSNDGQLKSEFYSGTYGGLINGIAELLTIVGDNT